MATDFARERGLIEKLEFRIAAADSSSKLQDILQKFLTPLLLKLASESAENRNLTIKVCQYINNRVKIDQTIQLPVQALSQTFAESSNAFVKQFSLLFLQQGLTRLSERDATAALPAVLRSSSAAESTSKVFAVSIDFLLTVLTSWRPPDRAEKGAQDLFESFDGFPAEKLSQSLSYFLLYDPKATQPLTDLGEVTAVFEKHFPARGSIVPNLAAFISTPLFSDIQRFMPATILSVDANSTASSKADTMFKQCDFDLESDDLVNASFKLYSIAKPRLQTRILTLLSRSKKSTMQTQTIVEYIDAQLIDPAANLEASKLRAAMFQYLMWAIRVNPEMGSVAARLRSSLRNFIETQGWPEATGLAHADVELRAKAYESIGLLAALKDPPQLQNGHEMEIDHPKDTVFDIVSWLFTSLRCDTTRDVRHSIEESLSRVMTLTTNIGQHELPMFRNLLFDSIMMEDGETDSIYFLETRNSVEYPAVRFANKVLPFADPVARMIDLVALTSRRKEVSEEGRHGLDPSWHAANARIGDALGLKMHSLPTFATFAMHILGDDDLALRMKPTLKNAGGCAGAVIFLRNLVAAEAWNGSSFAVDDTTDWQDKIDATLDNDSEARSLFRRVLSENDQHLVSKLLELCYEGMALGSNGCARVGFQLTSLALNDTLRNLELPPLNNLEVASRKTQIRYFACRVLGIILSLRADSESKTAMLMKACNGWATASGQTLADIEVSLLTLSFTSSRLALRDSSNANNKKVVHSTWQLCSDFLLHSTDRSLLEIAFISLGQIGLCLDAIEFNGLDDLVEAMLQGAKKENELAVTGLGRVLSALWTTLDATKQSSLLEKLYNLHEVRRAEFHFALGESLAVVALKFKSSSTITEFDVDEAVPHTFHPDLFSRLLDEVLEKSKTTKPSLRKATGIWLLSFVQFCTIDELIKPRLRDIQAAFSRLLSDRDEVVQETGSRGLGLVYQKGDKALRDDLVRDLVQSFTGNTAKTAGTVTEETQLFEHGALPTEGGQSVTTYKDIVSLAQEMGDPSLVYRFMNLASNNAIWTSRAAFGRFGLSGVLADSTYLKENKKFYPKLFRYRFDPNPNVQRSMNDIWKALVKDSNATIDEHFDIIMQDLLQSIVSGKEWRAREASCAAIADLVQGRDVEKLERYLDGIWKAAFKVLDDVKQSVRVAASKLCRTLTSMLLRNLEVGEGTTRRAGAMMKHAMPFLIQQMDGGAGKEVQGYAIGTLLEIVKKAPPTSLQNYAPLILENLISSLSSLEHESVNYLHLNADKYGMTAESLDKMRVQSIGISPVTEAIEKCLESLNASSTNQNKTGEMEVVEGYNTSLNDAMSRLESCFKTTIGLPSKVGLSRVMVALVLRHQTKFRPYADRFVRLTRKSIIDRNTTVSQSFSTALGYLLRLASEKEIRQTIAYAQKLYFDSQEVAHRAVAGEIVQAISKASNDVFKNFAPSILPFTFVGRKDLDEDVRERFEAAWKDNVGGSRTLHLYLKEITELTLKHIKSTLWPVRHACCFTVAELVNSIESGHIYSKEDANLVWPLVEESLAGKTWDGKEKVIQSFPAFVKHARVIWPTSTPQMRKIAIREAKRQNKSYRPSAINALAEFARLRLDLDMSNEVVPYLVETVSEVLDTSDDMDVDDDSTSKSRSSESLAEELLCSAITCLLAVLRPSSASDILDQSLQLAKKIERQNSNKIQMSLYEAATNFVQNINEVKQKNDAEQNDDLSLESPFVSTPAGSKFLHGLVLALFGTTPPGHQSHAEPSEALRRARSQLGSKLVASNDLSLPSRKVMDQTLSSWLQDERSKPLRLELETIASSNKRSMQYL